MNTFAGYFCQVLLAHNLLEPGESSNLAKVASTFCKKAGESGLPGESGFHFSHVLRTPADSKVTRVIKILRV